MTRILFVCTGNICRSPMAEGIARSAAASGSGLEFASAGIHALEGAPPSHHAVEAAAEIGVDVAGHSARQVTPRSARDADRIYVMTEAHRRQLARLVPEVASRIELLDPSGGDVADPYGSSIEAYRESRDRIAAAIAARLGEWRHPDGGRRLRPPAPP